MSESLFDQSVPILRPQDFLPIVTHIDTKTLLNKDGSLIQTLHLQHNQNIALNRFQILNLIHESLIRNIKNKNIAVWIHTLHSSKNTFIKFNIQDQISASLNYNTKIYTNDIYISLVYLPLIFSFKSFDAILNSLFPKIVEEFHDHHINNNIIILDQTMKDLYHDLKQLFPKILTLQKQKNKFYSPQLSLFRYLITLDKSPFYLLDQPLHRYFFIPHLYTVNDTYLTINKANQQVSNKYSRCASFRETYDIPINIIDEMLNCDIEMICTEVIIPSKIENLRQHSQYQKEIALAQKSSLLYEAKNYSQLLEGDNMFLNQNTINFISNSKEKLFFINKQFSKKLNNLGIINIIETVKLESIFWSQIPGNFTHLKRQQYSKDKICQFTTFGIENIGIPHLFKQPITLLKGNNIWYQYNFFDFQKKAIICLYGTISNHHHTMIYYFLLKSLPITANIIYISNNDCIYNKLHNSSLIDKKYQSSPLPNPLLSSNKNIIKQFFIDFAQFSNIKFQKTDIHNLDKFVTYILKCKVKHFSKMVKSFIKKEKIDHHDDFAKIMNQLQNETLLKILNSKNKINFIQLKTGTMFFGINLHDFLEQINVSIISSQYIIFRSFKISYLLWFSEIFIDYKATSNIEFKTGIMVIENITNILNLRLDTPEKCVKILTQKITKNNLVLLTSMNLEFSQEEQLFYKNTISLFPTKIIFNNNENNIFALHDFDHKKHNQDYIQKISQQKNIVIIQNDHFYVLDVNFINLINNIGNKLI